MKILTTITLSK